MLSVDRVEKTYMQGGLFSSRKRQILKPISFELMQGECLGIIGESGSGKSTLGRILLGIEKADSGVVRFEGSSMQNRKTRGSSISAVFQDYRSSINPFFTVEKAIMESLRLRKLSHGERDKSIDSLLSEVGLHPSYRKKHVHELSGGEAQRVCIARAVGTKPKCLLLDEAISSLDGSVQIQVLELLKNLKEVYQISYIFITHDIQAAVYICDRIMILHEGRIEETVEVDKLRDVQSSYARKLLRMIIS